MTYNVIFQLDQPSETAAKALIQQTKNARKALPALQVEWVLHGKAVNLLRKTPLPENDPNSLTSGSIEVAFSTIAQEPEIKIMACRHALNRQKITESQLFDFVEIIPSAVARLIVRQTEGWAYIKVND